MLEKKAVASLIIGIIGIISLTLNVSLSGFLGNFIVEGIDYLVFYKKIPEWFDNFLEISYICLHLLFVFIFFFSIFGLFLESRAQNPQKKELQF
jgi:uncharacterized protein involved in cysteine biosynthesis